jgi:DNA polymerase III epsilon subunit-like protein
LIIAGIDVETTGLDGDDIEVVEVGYCVFDTEGMFILSAGSELYSVDKWSDEAAKHHGIPEYATKIANQRPHQSNIDERILAYKPEVIVSHNASFDHPKVTKCWPKLKEIKWLCTLQDFPHEEVLKTSVTSRRLMHLAVDYGIPVHGWHRAGIDAEMACRIAAKHDIRKLYNDSLLPKFRVTTRGRYSEEGKNLTRQLKFRWDSESKVWWRDGFTKADADIVEKIVKKAAPGWSVEITPMPPRSY